MTTEIKRLFDEYAVQDTGAFAYVYLKGEHIKVAMWNEGNQMWVITPEGRELVAATEAPVVESDNTSASEEKATKGKKAKFKADEELNLDEI